MHQTVAIQVWADVDGGIADTVAYLNTIEGVRTHASCEGTIGEGGPEPYRAYVMASWPPEVADRLKAEFDVTEEGENWGRLEPRDPTCSRCAAPLIDGNDGCGDPACPGEEA
jgi:hypothetical protein